MRRRWLAGLAVAPVICLSVVGASVATAGSAVGAVPQSGGPGDSPGDTDATCGVTTCTASFVATGASQTFVVPSFVTAATITAAGAQGGGANGGGGQGGAMRAAFPLAGGQTLTLIVGQQGVGQDFEGDDALGQSSTYGGGGAGGNAHQPDFYQPPGAPSGGGGTFVFDGNGSLLIAAGGGGGDFEREDDSAATPTYVVVPGGAGGGYTAATNGGDGTEGVTGGGAASSTAPGAGGNAGTSGFAGEAGSAGDTYAADQLAQGGQGADGVQPGGGGGGGYAAGGGGGANDVTGDANNLPTDNGTGGGGGSGYVASIATDVTHPADSGAGDGYGLGDGQLEIDYDLVPQTVAFQSAPLSAKAEVGQHYTPAASGGASSNPVTLSIDGETTNSACTLVDNVVSFDHAGVCVVDGNQAGDRTEYADASQAQQTIIVGQPATATRVGVHAKTVTATVAPVAPGAGVPTGQVMFAVDGKAVAVATLSGDLATAKYVVAPGQAHSVSASYHGDADFQASAGSTRRTDPIITASVTSTHAPTTYGWYAQKVTVSFSCEATSASLVGICPKPVTLTESKAAQSASGTITATDGGAATTTISPINIDTQKPAVSITGVRKGVTYAKAPKPICVANDVVSGLAGSCRATTTRGQNKHGQTAYTTTATATDRAGNKATKTITYAVGSR